MVAVASIALLLLLFLASVFFLSRGGTAQKQLYGSLPAEEAAPVLDALEKLQIPHDVDPKTGDILVPENRVYEARMRLAAQGLPRAGGPGFELLDKPQGFGVSEFMENTRYQRALEGELARSIAGLDQVQEARVHLAIPKQPVFVRDHRQPSASVVVSLYPGRTLDKDQVQAIMHLVAAAVVEMTPDQVQVVDQKGNLLSDKTSRDPYALSSEQLAFQRQLEKMYAERITSILTPIVGKNRVRAEVAAELDLSANEEAQEVYDRDRTAVRSEQMKDEETTNVAPMGVPGALSNQPPAAGTAPQVAVPQAAPGAQQRQQALGFAPQQRQQAQPSIPTTRSHQLTRNWEITRIIHHNRTPPGSIRRLTVAVMVDNPLRRNPEGKWEKLPLQPEELDRLRGIVQGAVGYNAQRGDVVSVENAEFLMAEPLVWWQQPWFWDLVRQGLWWLLILGAMVATLLLLRRALTPPPPAPEEEAAPPPEEVPAEEMPPPEEEVVPEEVLPEEEIGAEAPPMTEAEEYQALLEQVRKLATDDPKRVALLMRQWLEEHARPRR
mgnify:CR=1 FL=1